MAAKKRTRPDNLADRMVEIYNEGRHASYMGEGAATNPHPQGSAEHHCWAHGWQDETWETDDAIEFMRAAGPDCGGIVADGCGRVLAQAWPAEGGAA